jgi:hypothetical protein
MKSKDRTYLMIASVAIITLSVTAVVLGIELYNQIEQTNASYYRTAIPEGWVVLRFDCTQNSPDAVVNTGATHPLGNAFFGQNTCSVFVVWQSQE